MLTVLTWKWHTPGYRSTFTADHVNTLRRMVARHYQRPHLFACATDDPAGIESGIAVLPLPTDFADVPNPHGPRHPSCYRRLAMFGPAAAQMFGERFVSLDLDTVVTGDLAPLFDRDVDFAMWADPINQGQFNGSLLLMSAGARPQVWASFDPETSPSAALEAGKKGSDQGWISYCLGAGEATFGRVDGVYSYRSHLRGRRNLPPGARLVFFHGQQDPWGDEAQQLPWVRRASEASAEHAACQ